MVNHCHVYKPHIFLGGFFNFPELDDDMCYIPYKYYNLN